MARIAPVPCERVDPSLHDVVARAQERLPQFMHQVLTLAHRPRLAHDLIGLYLGFQDDSCVDRRLIELAVLTVSHLNQCVYCVSHHTPLGLESGLDPAALADLRNGRTAESIHFTLQEKLVIAYAEQVTHEARRVPPHLFAALQEHFDNAQIVELTVRIALANFFNRFNDALQIELEPGVQALL